MPRNVNTGRSFGRRARMSDGAQAHPIALFCKSHRADIEAELAVGGTSRPDAQAGLLNRVTNGKPDDD